MVGEGKYNLVLRETRVTDSFLDFDLEARGCQNEEPVQNCTTRQHVDTIVENCKCLPLNINNNSKVNIWNLCRLFNPMHPSIDYVIVLCNVSV